MQMIEHKGKGSSDLTSGQMLLMGFNGLFTRLDDEFTNLLEAVDAINVPDIWKKVDAVREARSMQVILCLTLSMWKYKVPFSWKNRENCYMQHKSSGNKDACICSP